MKNSLVNENKLFSVIGNFFTGKDNLMFEMIQNSLWAGAQNITINAPHTGNHPFGPDADTDRIISISDDGRGIGDIFSLLGIAFSNWDQSISSQQPAGMGFLQLLALAERVHIRSRFGVLTLDCQAFLNDPDYRQSVIAVNYTVDPEFTGTEIFGLMKQPAWMYLKSDKRWYTGCLGVSLSLNGEEINASGMRDRVDRARALGTLYKVGRYKSNPILIEAGYLRDLSTLSGSLVNWYGQLIPISFGYRSLAGNLHIRVYYEVKRGTPLTPRYPDRSSLNYDDKFLELQDFVNGEAEKLLLPYFSGELDRPLIHGNVSLLEDLYRYAEQEKMREIPWLPVRRDIFRDHDCWCNSLMSKDDLAGHRFCTEALQIDGEYNLGADLDDLKIVQAGDYVAPYLRETGLKEVIEINSENPPQRTITLEPLRLRIIQADGGEETVVLNEAVLCNGYNDVFVYATDQSRVLGIFDDYGDDALTQEDDRNWDDLKDVVRSYLVEAMESYCQACSQHRFDFLPRHQRIKQIRFEGGRVLLEYDDGEQKTLALLEAS